MEFESLAGTQVSVMLSPRHSGDVEGICGNYDGIYDNDLNDVSSGQIAATPRDYVSMWKTSSSCPDPDLPEDYDPCAVRSTSVLNICILQISSEQPKTGASLTKNFNIAQKAYVF